MDDREKFNAFVDSFEFHEAKVSGCICNIISLQVYIKPNLLRAFCEWIAGESWTSNYQKELCETNLTKMLTWTREDPTFTLDTPECTVQVHPKKNMVSYANGGIHYICQHSFAMFPHQVRQALMSCYRKKNRQKLGLLYPRALKRTPSAPLIVYDNDIHEGFMQTAEENKTYDDDFVTFIRRRRFLESQTGSES